MNSVENFRGWHTTKIETFWNKIAFQKKVFHIYDDEQNFIDILAGFVGTGINANECTVVIATTTHLLMLQKSLEKHGLYVNLLIEDDRYVPISAESILPKFMVDGLPDRSLFFKTISEILASFRRRGRAVRTYREMSSLLWERGNKKATSELERLWTSYSEKNLLSLFCAYARSESNWCETLKEMSIFNCKVIAKTNTISEILYKDCVGN